MKQEVEKLEKLNRGVEEECIEGMTVKDRAIVYR